MRNRNLGFVIWKGREGQEKKGKEMKLRPTSSKPSGSLLHFLAIKEIWAGDELFYLAMLDTKLT